MKTTLKTPEIGKILVSEPFLLASYFKRSVVLLSKLGCAGAVGFILNKPTDLALNDALEDFPQFDVPLYFGGPVQTNTIHFIHNLGDKLEGSKKIMEGVWWGGSLETLKLLIETKQVTEKDIRFFAGYTGWETDQLETELKGHTWMLTSGNSSIVFSKAPEQLWGSTLKQMGSEYAVLANFPDDPSLN